MNIQSVFLPNDTEKALASAFRRLSKTLPGNADPLVAASRAGAMAHFEKTGLPHRRLESWRYTDLRHLLTMPPDLNISARHAVGRKEFENHPLVAALKPLNPYWMVFIDGTYVADLSGGPSLPEGAEISALSQGPLPSWAQDNIISQDAECIGSIFNLNTALMSDGALIRLREGVNLQIPIAIVYLGASNSSSHSRNIIEVENGASISIAEAHGSLGKLRDVTTVAAMWRIGDNTRVDHIKVQQMSETSVHLAPHLTQIGAISRVSSFTMSLGASLSREERQVHCEGKDTSISMSGSYIIDGKRHCDTTLIVNHEAPGCVSREKYKGLVDDCARGVFQGSIIVDKIADKTDAKQSVDAIILSDDASHNAKPELEIYADDVQCGHGATTGELDSAALFYLCARGIPVAKAEGILIAAFVRDGLQEVERGDLREVLERLADEKLSGRNAGNEIRE